MGTWDTEISQQIEKMKKVWEEKVLPNLNNDYEHQKFNRDVRFLQENLTRHIDYPIRLKFTVSRKDSTLTVIILSIVDNFTQKDLLYLFRRVDYLMRRKKIDFHISDKQLKLVYKI